MLWEGLEYSRCWQEVTEAIPVKACLSLGPGAKVTARSKVHRSGEALLYGVKVGKPVNIPL